MGMVLQLSLCSSYFWYLNSTFLWPSVDSFYADLKGLDKISFEFELGKPFKPFEQLMGVLPVASMENVPLAFRVCDLHAISDCWR